MDRNEHSLSGGLGHCEGSFRNVVTPRDLGLSGLVGGQSTISFSQDRQPGPYTPGPLPAGFTPRAVSLVINFPSVPALMDRIQPCTVGSTQGRRRQPVSASWPSWDLHVPAAYSSGTGMDCGLEFLCIH